jgi:2-amino-4-hydroxy-6-hydroxymethyldihydropteridine diphosphokinase
VSFSAALRLEWAKRTPQSGTGAREEITKKISQTERNEKLRDLCEMKNKSMKVSKETAHIGIGSNLGNRHHNCLQAVDRLRRIPDVEVTGVSGWYLTKPIGVDGQDWYVNGVVSLDVKMSPQGLLERLMSVEQAMGRVRKERWGPRVIDLDILLFWKKDIHEDNLIVPHPLMHVRRFVLVPMADLAPDVIHPTVGATMTQLLKGLPDDGQEVVPLEE